MLPDWPGASEVYSRAYRTLEHMAQHGHVKVGRYQPVGRGLDGKTIMGRQRVVSEEMDELIQALDSGDEETIKAIMWKRRVYGDVPTESMADVHPEAYEVQL